MPILIQMDNEFIVGGAPVVSTTEPEKPYNPLNRPKIYYKKPIFCSVLYIVIFVSLLFIPKDFVVNKWIVIAVFSVLYFALIVKRATIWFIHLYQNKASDETRLRCVFEPSCSEYMILAIQKYGWLRGVIKGIKRLGRCHPPNGGKDYP